MAFKSSIFPPGYENLSGAPFTPETIALLQEGDERYIPSMDGREYRIGSRAGVRAFTEWVLAAGETLEILAERTQAVFKADVASKVKVPIVLQELSFQSLYWSMVRVMGELYVRKRYTADEFARDGVQGPTVFIEYFDRDPTTPAYEEGTRAVGITSPHDWIAIGTERHRQAMADLTGLEPMLREAGLPVEFQRSIQIGSTSSLDHLMELSSDTMKAHPALIAGAIVAVSLVGVGIITFSISIRPLILSLADWMNTINEMNELNLEVAQQTEDMCMEAYAGNPEAYNKCANDAIERMVDNAEALNDIGIGSLTDKLLGVATAFGTAVLLGGAALGAFLLLRD